jgi:hypothetical protein
MTTPMIGAPELPCWTIVYERIAVAATGATVWNAKYVVSDQERREFTRFLAGDPSVLQYEVYKVRYINDGGMRRPARQAPPALVKSKEPTNPRRSALPRG